MPSDRRGASTATARAGPGAKKIESNGSAIVSIVDPVTGVSSSLIPDARIAWKSPTLDAEKIMKMAELSRQKEEAMMRSGLADSSKAASSSRPSASESSRRRPQPPPPAAKRVEGKKEHIEGPLESKTIEGVGVTGRRSTTTLKAGAIGNDLPITITSEEWSSPDLQILVMTRHNDPRSGESSYRLTNIVRAEPDRSLFLVPAEYTVKEAGMVRNFVMQ